MTCEHQYLFAELQLVGLVVFLELETLLFLRYRVFYKALIARMFWVLFLKAAEISFQLLGHFTEVSSVHDVGVDPVRRLRKVVQLRLKLFLKLCQLQLSGEQPRCIDLLARHKEEQIKILMLVIYNYLQVFLRKIYIYIFGTGKGLYSLASLKIVFSFIRCTKQELQAPFPKISSTWLNVFMSINIARKSV